MNPTQFAIQPFRNISTDDTQSMLDITEQIKEDSIVEYDNCKLLRLTDKVVHRVNPNPSEGWRSFLEVTISKHRFAKLGNSHNYLFNYNWPMVPRSKKRNICHG